MDILWLGETGIEARDTVGGKGANLGQLIRMGMPAPPGFAVTTRAYAVHTSQWSLNQVLRPLVAQQDWAAVEEAAREIIAAGPISAALLEAITEARHQLGASAVAVRSSATAEDLSDAAFAGQHETVLDVEGEEALVQALRRCWISLWSRRALHYRHERSMDHFIVRMAVVIQEMVPADAAGVLFTVDPVSWRSDRLLIEMVAGPGEAVVSGTAAVERFSVDRQSLQVVDRDVKGGLMTNEQQRELCRLSLAIEEKFGSPQDVEFALSSGRIHILQTRPITTLPEADATPEPLEPLGKPSLPDRVMKPVVAERYTVAPRPLDNITFTRMVGAALFILKARGAVVAPEDEAVFRSRVWRQAYRFPPVSGLWRVLLLSGFHQYRLLKRDWQSWWESGPREAIRATAHLPDLSSLSDTELLERADRILDAWEEPLNTRFSAASAFPAEFWLRLVVTLAVGRRVRDRIVADLMSGLDHETLKMNEALWELSRQARRDPAVLSAVRDVTPERLKESPEGMAFLTDFEKFISKYGQREGSCWYLSTPTWRRDPMQVWRLLASIAEVERRLGNGADVRVRFQNARTLVERRLRFYPFMTCLFHWLVDRLRSLSAFREDSHFDLALPLDSLQEIAAHWGRRLEQNGVIERADDVYYLTHDEVREWLTGSSPGAETVRKLVAHRRSTYRVADARWQEERLTEAAPKKVLKGIGVSPGTVRARVRVIRGEEQFHRLQPGEVLVCPHTSPAWTPLFTVAAAVVAETGGAASHAAIVAREYAIPAVMGVPGITRLLEEGQEIVVDGIRGTVRC